MFSSGLDSHAATFRRRICDECRGSRGLQNILAIKAVRIGIACLLAGHHANTDAEAYAFCRTLDDLLLEHNGMIDSVLEEKIGVVTPARERLAQIRFEISE